MGEKNKEIRNLIKLLNDCTYAYDLGKPIISDTEWDKLYFKLKALEEETGIIYANSPTQKIDYRVVSELEPVFHSHPMLSLDKTKEVSDVMSFGNKGQLYAMAKMDGLTCSLTYKNGKLVRAETRGDGTVGEIITHNIMGVKGVPLKLSTDFKDIVIDGEIICTEEDFAPFAGEYKHPRNFASGSIRLLDAKESASRNLTFVAWDLIKGHNCKTLFDKYAAMRKMNFIVAPAVPVEDNSKENISKIINFLAMDSKSLGYPIDGVVFKYDDCELYDSLGATDHHFRGGLAYKFYDAEYDTEMIDIEWTLGRTGVLTPVAVFKPIEIDGTTVERASLHNVSIMYETLNGGSHVGQKIRVFKANAIIPQISWAEGRNDNFNKLIRIPNACPVCGGQTKIVVSDSGVKNLMCTNPHCSGKVNKRIEHFCSKKGLDIKGLSETTIGKLLDWGYLSDIKSLYSLADYRQEWIDKPGFGPASVDKLLSAIEESKKNVDLANFIAALGIPLIGLRVSKTIVEHFDTWEKFRNNVGKDWTFIDGFGYEMEHSLNTFDFTEADELVKIVNVAAAVLEKPASQALSGKNICVTGKLTQFKNRDALVSEIEANGGNFCSGVSSKTDILVNNDINSTSSKNVKAKALGIPIITEEELVNMMKG